VTVADVAPDHEISAAPRDATRGRRLRVASCINSVSVSGGSELNAVRTAEALTSRGHTVRAVILTDDPGGMAARYRAGGMEVNGFPVRSLVGAGAVRQVLRAARFFRTQQIDVVHTHDCYTNFLMVPAARLAGIPVLASKRWVFQTFPQHRVTDRISYWLADAVLANSNEVARSAHTVEGVPQRRITVIPNFVDDEVFSAKAGRSVWRAQFGASSDVVLFVIVAQLRPEKNHAVLLDAFAQVLWDVPGARLAIVGDGPERGAIEERIDRLGLQAAVVMAGHVDRAWRTLAAADIAVLPSQHEGFPNSVVEAMAVGVPVIASNVGGIPDAVHDGVTGLLVERDQLGALANAMRTLALDAALRTSFGHAAQRVAHDSFRQDAVIDRLEACYRTLTGIVA
jgi:glycosyltransferase involved in cell wall biosynthesis